MTWADFKAALERMGVRDDDVINYIDVEGDCDNVAVTRGEGDGKIMVENF